MVDFTNIFQEVGLNSSPELQTLCEKVYLLGRKSIADAQLQGRLNSPKFKGRGNAKDKIKHGRDLTKKYKYILFNLKASAQLSDMNKLREFVQRVNDLEVIDRKLYPKLKQELDSIRCLPDLQRLQEAGRRLENGL